MKRVVLRSKMLWRLLIVAGLALTFSACGGSSGSSPGSHPGSPSVQSYVINTIAGGGPNSVPAVKASIDPFAVATDSGGNVYIASTSFGPPVVFKVDPSGTLTIVAGNGFSGYAGDEGPATEAALVDPFGVAVDDSGNIYVADYANNRIREVVGKTGVIQTVAGDGNRGYSGDGGEATQAELSGPSAVAVDGSGNIFITDSNNNVIREVVTATGVIQTVAGNGKPGYSGDGGKATQAQLDFPAAACVDNSGNIFIAEPVNPRISEVVAATGIIQTVAGNGSSGYSGDGGPATQAQLGFPEGLFVDGSGNLFIADAYYSSCQLDPDGNPICMPAGGGVIRKVDSKTGNIQTVAGNGTLGYSGDGGTATQAELSDPNAVYVDPTGNVFISDFANEVIREVTAATGVIQTIAGKGTAGYSGDGGKASQAELKSPSGVWLDKSGNVFIADQGNNRIREVVSASGIIQTVAGNGTAGYSGDGEAAAQAELGSPVQVVVDSAGNVLFADPLSRRIRKLTPSN